MSRLAVVLAACGGRAAPAPALHNEVLAPAVDQGGLTLDLERTACLGACPTYRVHISRDGRVDWQGLANVRVVGKAHGSIERRQLDQLAVLLEMAKFYDREMDGLLGKRHIIAICTDLPSVKLSASEPGHHNAVDYDGCEKDPDLENLILEIEHIAGVAAWR